MSCHHPVHTDFIEITRNSFFVYFAQFPKGEQNESWKSNHTHTLTHFPSVQCLNRGLPDHIPKQLQCQAPYTQLVTTSVLT